MLMRYTAPASESAAKMRLFEPGTGARPFSCTDVAIVVMFLTTGVEEQRFTVQTVSVPRVALVRAKSQMPETTTKISGESLRTFGQLVSVHERLNRDVRENLLCYAHKTMTGWKCVNDCSVWCGNRGIDTEERIDTQRSEKQFTI